MGTVAGDGRMRWTQGMVGVPAADTTGRSSCVAGECVTTELLLLRLLETIVKGS